MGLGGGARIVMLGTYKMRRRVFHFLPTSFVFFLFFAPCVKAQGTYTAASCNQSDLNAVINGPMHTVVNGDTIHIPAGSCTWTSGITVPSGIGVTIIGNGTPDAGAGTTGASASCSATVLTDNISSGHMFSMSPQYGNSTSRISCISFVPQTSSQSNDQPISVVGTCTSSGCPNMRIDNLTVSGNFAGSVREDATFVTAVNMFGVLDHNTVGGATLIGNGVDFVNVNHPSWLGVGSYGDNSWAQPDSFGTAQALYLENNTFTNAFGTDVDGGDSYQDTGGGRWVCRFNTFNGVTGASACSDHGTESTGRPRGGRQGENYNNTLICTNTSQGCNSGFGYRSGVGLIFNNTFTANSGAWFNNYATFVDFRTFAGVGTQFAQWGICDGTSVYDANDSVVYYSGTYTGVTGSTTFTDSAQTWTAAFGSSSWASNAAATGAPYSIYNVTRGFGGEIASNSGSNLTFTVLPICTWSSQTDCTWTSGDIYQILRAKACLDQPTRSGGTLLSGSTPVPAVSIGQSLDPTYEWGDTHTGSFNNAPAASQTARLIRNRDFYYENANQSAQTSATYPFDGSTTIGVGHGPSAFQPTTCTTGVAYWATDQGNWNQSGSGGQGELFKCTSTNTWTLSYTPYTYPHPLTSNTAVTSVNPPQNLTATVQ